MARVLGGDAGGMLHRDTPMPRESDSASHVSPNAILVYMQQSRGVVGLSVNIVRRRASSRRDSVVHVAGRERAIHATK